MFPGMILHAAHNSGTVLIALLGVGGVLAYCCILIPLVDYGALILLIVIFAWAVLRKKKKNLPMVLKTKPKLPKV